MAQAPSATLPRSRPGPRHDGNRRKTRRDGQQRGYGGGPQPIGVGPEMRALSRFYRDVTWEGTVHAGGMGPGTPAMTGVGRGTVQAIQDGRWIVLDCEQDQFLPDGTLVLK